MSFVEEHRRCTPPALNVSPEVCADNDTPALMANEAVVMNALQQSRTATSAPPTPRERSASMAPMQEDTTMIRDPSIPSLDQILNLVDLPIEIQTDIYSLVITHSGPIKPELWLPGESIFTHDTVYITMGCGLFLRNPTCRMVRAVINGTHLFYRLNRFEFGTPLCMLDYLKALPTARRQAIKDVMVLFDPSPWACLKSGLTILRTCLGLRHLTIDITLLYGFFENSSANIVDQLHAYDKLIALRGLERLTVTYGADGSAWDLVLMILKRVRFVPVDNISENAVRAEVRDLETRINGFVTLVRDPVTSTLVSADDLAEALSHSNVVDGDVSATADTEERSTTSDTHNLTNYEQSNADTPTVYQISDKEASWANDVTPAHWGRVTTDQEDEGSSW
ncbi:uncharacterized protein PAC_11691 [Phialocephala subalpina]|uniref:Uncharacterized protein n=1 Tax=Phialocephala subalpina TaxID=576137 RepID=A0A1L7X9U2_9HELO|nr:uncharacterized protein PAC_11691 [Phialocephala subalpina]